MINFHKVKSPKISMALLVKNEIDIIEKNIRFHSKMGVDSFVIMDNNSDDGTYEKLKELSKEFEITLIQNKEPYKQSKFMTYLTKLAKKKYNPNWIINSDADEFWVSKEGLKKSLQIKGSVLQIPRYNMTLYKGLSNWWESEYKVVNQVLYKEGEPNIILGKIGRKVIINPKGYLKTNSGNHSAEHLLFWQKREFREIEIFHYPIRSYEQFEKNIKNRAALLKIGAKMGNHYKMWAKAYEQNRLKEEFEKIIFDKEKLKCLEDVNIIKKDSTIKEMFEKFKI